jgi:hypothetical protein
VARHPVRVGGDRKPALDLVSYGRRGPGRPERFAPEQVAQIARTVRRAPEVMVKVSGGGKSLGAVAAHFRYITRKGTLELETDDGERLTGSDGQRQLDFPGVLPQLRWLPACLMMKVTGPVRFLEFSSAINTGLPEVRSAA